MYRDLYVYIVINRYRSERIFLKHGFMEGHSPSMAAFVSPLIGLAGIRTPDHKIHKIKLFDDDMKLFISKLEDINKAEGVIKQLEKV